jgi:serine/threonine-protein kinase
MKLSDFGIARDTQSTALTAAGKTVGTMSYMAPEQITGKHPISAKTDLYAFGCVLFEMLTGRTPFVTETAPEMLFKHLDEEPPSVREYNITVPIWLDRLIAELLAKDPADRPFDALAVQVKLEEVKERMAAGKSIVQQTMAGGGATLNDGDGELARLLGRRKKKKKKREHVPVYERMWFLGIGLVAVIALLTWGFWPASEEERFAALVQLREGGEASSVVDKYKLQGFVDDFPAGRHAGQVQQWIDDIEMTQAEKQAEQREKQGRDPESHAERLYMEARQYERFGDRLTALKKYQALQPLFENDEQARAFVNLARRKEQEIKESIGGESDPITFVEQAIAEADRLFFQGQRVQAQNRWQSLIALYENLPEHEEQVNRARARILDPEWALTHEYNLDTREGAPAEPGPAPQPDAP